MASKPGTVKEFLNTLPADRRTDIEAVRKVILENLPPGYEESAGSGMLLYSVPLSACPDTYNGQPLSYAALSSRKGYMTLHLMPLYGNESAEQRLRRRFEERGKKLDMGKACVRFKAVDDLPLDVIGEVIASHPVDKWIGVYRASREPAERPKARK
jgi:hypothetical protein